MKKLLSLILSLVLIVSVVPMGIFTLTASAAKTCSSGWAGTCSSSTTELNKIIALMQQQTSEYKISRFNVILSEYSLSQYFCTNKDTGCNFHCSHTNGQCKSKYRITDEETGEEIDLKSHQCLGYARYCSYKFFGNTLYNSFRTVPEKDLKNESTFKQYLSKYSDLTGAHFRVNSTHSLVYLARDDTYIYFIDANSGDCEHYTTHTYTNEEGKKVTCVQTQCKIHLRRFTYSKFLEKYTSLSIEYQESPNSSSVYTQSVLNDNVISGTNAKLYGRIEKPYSHTVNQIGIRVRKEGTAYTDDWTKKETPTGSTTKYKGKTLVQPYYNLNTELGITLTPGTRYYYQFYGKVNNVEYWSAESSFVATTSSSSSSSSSSSTSVSISHGYTGCTDTITADNAVVYGTLNKSSGTTVEKFGIRLKKTGGSYSTAWTYTHNPKSTYSSSTSVKFWYDIKDEMGITLNHLTGYTYQLYAKVDEVEYWSSEKSFTTTGSHSYGAWTTTKSATCTTAGSKTRKCSGCSMTETVTIAALGHNYSTSWTTDKAATCTTAGSKSHHCTRCSAKADITTIAATGHSYADATCTKAKTCTVCKATTGSALGHKQDNGTVTKKATCTATGTKTYKCTACGTTTKTETITKLGHKYSNACDKTCNTCGAKRTVPAHKYTNDCDTTCNVCSAKRTIKHTYTNSCDKTCNVCKATRTIKHTYTNDCDKTCNVCKATRTITHSYKTTTTKATLTKNGKTVVKCTVCGSVKSTTTIKYAKTIKLSKTTFTYNGKVQKPTVTVKDSAGKTISSKYYTVTFASGCKNVGKYKVTIKFKGNYSGTKTLYFTINPTKTTLSKVTPATKKLTVTYTKKTAQVSGYEVQYSTSKSFTTKTTKTKIVSKNTTTKATITGLKAKTTYYVRVRTYKTVSGKKYYSGWSTVKSAKTK